MQIKQFAQGFLGLTLLLSSSVITAKKCCNKNSKNKWDYVIVGGGTAGATLASKLSDPDADGKFRNSVLVLEFGIDGSNDPEVLANTFLTSFGASNDPKWSKWTESTTFSGIQAYPSEGVMWGGGAGHNNLQWYRATPDIYDQWASISGNPAWSFINLLNNVLIPIEHYTPDPATPSVVQRGLTGPIFVSQEPSVATDPVSIGISIASGAPLVQDINNSLIGEVGVSANQDTVTPPYGSPNSIRSYAGNSFLRGISSEGILAIVDANGNGLNGRKLKVISNAFGTRVLFSKAKRGGLPTAKSVEYFLSNDPDKLLRVKARKKVILATGGIYDAAMLQRSGIGDANLLNSLGIPVVFDNSNVGKNLQNHVGFEGVISCPTTVGLPGIGNAFIGLTPTEDVRTLQIFYTPALLFLPIAIRELLDITEGTLIIGLDDKPGSRGTVEIVSSDPLRAPKVTFNSYSDGGPSDFGSDANKVVRFYNLLQDIAANVPDADCTVLYPTPAQYSGGPDALFQAGLATFLMAFHMTGSCSMGSSAANGVIDGSLNVFGVNNLMVVSNASAPVISDANTGLQAYVLGYQAARILRGE